MYTSFVYFALAGVFANASVAEEPLLHKNYSLARVQSVSANKPIAVAMRASLMPGATTARFVDPVAPIRLKATMMPTTVPNRPIYGDTLAAVARNVTRFSSLVTSTVAARISARSTASRLFKVGRAAAVPGLDGAGCGLPVTRNCALSSA